MTHIEERWIQREGGQKNYLRIWDVNQPKKGIVLIVTGMTEHVRRYDTFARYLNQKGYLVAAADHRGQGQTSLRNGRLGNMEKGDFRKIVGDQKYYINMLRKEHEGLPVFMICHSFGSFIGQKFIQKYSEKIDGIVLLGSLKHPKSKAVGGALFIKPLALLTGRYFNSHLANNLTFYNFNKKFENENSKFAWICSDKEVVRRYEKDPLCGYQVSNSFLLELSKSVSQLYNIEQLRQIRKSLPILIIAGGADPLNNRGKWVLDLFIMYRELGIKSVQLKLYDKMRHEVLNEIGKEQVFEQIFDFLEQSKKTK